MSWRTIIIENKCKLSYKNDYLMVRTDEVRMVHLSEIAVVLVETTAATITAFLMSKLAKWKIPIMFCDQKHNPVSLTFPINVHFKTSQRIKEQIQWDEERIGQVWKKIIENKIDNQITVLTKAENGDLDEIKLYRSSVKIMDKTNREGLASKLYFPRLFGGQFIRHESDNINVALNYGYTILLSFIVREIAAQGYITQLGIFHSSQFNPYNLASDLMEPFRPFIDEYVYSNRYKEFDCSYKRKLIKIMDKKVRINNGNYYMKNAISLYVQRVFAYLDKRNEELLDVGWCE